MNLGSGTMGRGELPRDVLLEPSPQTSNLQFQTRRSIRPWQCGNTSNFIYAPHSRQVPFPVSFHFMQLSLLYSPSGSSVAPVTTKHQLDIAAVIGLGHNFITRPLAGHRRPHPPIPASQTSLVSSRVVLQARLPAPCLAGASSHFPRPHAPGLAESLPP